MPYDLDYTPPQVPDSGSDTKPDKKAAQTPIEAAASIYKPVQIAAAKRDKVVEEGVSKIDSAKIPEPPKLESSPNPKDYQTSPAETWGSAGMFLAVFGSLMTKHPMTTALNSAAGVMKAANEKDASAFNQAMDKFKIDTDNAWKMANYNQKLYEDIIGKDEAMVNLRAKAAGDDVMVAMNQAGLAGQLYADRQRNAESFNEGRMKNAEVSRRIKMYMDKGMSEADAQTKAYDSVWKTSQAQNDKLTKATEVQVKGIDNTLTEIDKVIKKASDIGSAGLPLGGGLSGKVNTVQEALDATQGETDAPEADFQSQLKDVKAKALLYLGTGKRLSPDERKLYIDSIPESGIFVTQNSQIAGLKNLAKFMKMKREEIQMDSDSSGGYSSIEQIKADYDSGKITPEEARRIATNLGLGE